MPIIPSYGGSRVSLRSRTRLISGPKCLPVPTKDVVGNIGLRGNLANPELISRIQSATQLVEKYLNRVLVAQTWDLFLDDAYTSFPSIFSNSYPVESPFRNYSIELPRAPLLSVTGIYVADDQSTETQIDPTQYYVSTSQDPGRISLVTGSYWPYHRAFEGFRVRFTAGYVVPFTASAGILTAPNNPFVGGELLRVSKGLNDDVPSTLTTDIEYQITNVQGNTLQLLDPDGNLLDQADSSGFGSYSFLGELPEPIRREIAVMAAGKDQESEKAPNQKASSRNSRMIEYLDGFEQRLKYFRLVNI